MLYNNRVLFTRLFLLWLFVLGAVSGIWQDDVVLPVAADKAAVTQSQQSLSTQPLPSSLTKNRQFDYNITLPLVGYNSCALNPLVDQFDNHASGWPSFMTEETTVGYVDGRYHIYHLRGSQWLALTRRDGSERKITFSVDIETVDNSVSGIIFGLKPHWTEFYSVEYYPEYKTAAFFHYTNATGWELIHYQRDDSFPNQGSFYVQLHPNPDPFTPSPPYPTEAYISVLGRTNFSISNVDLRGSIGLLGGTTNGRGTTWFDNYNLDRQSCEFMNWSSPSNINSSADVGDFHIEAVPANVAERPPFETFLTAEQHATLFATPEP